MKHRSKQITKTRKMTHAKGALLKLQEDGIAGSCVWVIALAEGLLNDGFVEMAHSLSVNILSLWKGLSREESIRLRKIVDAAERSLCGRGKLQGPNNERPHNPTLPERRLSSERSAVEWDEV
jgi:hypothetical protein